MMKILILFSILFSYNVIAQNVNLKFVDSISKEPIEYVKIYSYLDKKTSFSSPDGNQGGFKKNDTLLINCPGYYHKKIAGISSNEIILLSPIFTQLDEIVITNDVQKNFDYGYHNNKIIKSPIKFYGTISAVYVPTDFKNEKSIFKDLFFVIKNKGKKQGVNVRPILYKTDGEGNLIEQLINENIILNIDKRKDIYSIDISHLKISVPKNGVFLGLEMVEGTDCLDIGFGVIKNNPTESYSYYILENENNIWTQNLNMKHNNSKYLNFLYGFNVLRID